MHGTCAALRGSCGRCAARMSLDYFALAVAIGLRRGRQAVAARRQHMAQEGRLAIRATRCRQGWAVLAVASRHRSIHLTCVLVEEVCSAPPLVRLRQTATGQARGNRGPVSSGAVRDVVLDHYQVFGRSGPRQFPDLLEGRGEARAAPLPHRGRREAGVCEGRQDAATCRSFSRTLDRGGVLPAWTRSCRTGRPAPAAG